MLNTLNMDTFLMFRYYVGIKKDTNEAYLRTLNGRPAPLVNFGPDQTVMNGVTAGCAYIDFKNPGETYERSYWKFNTDADCYVETTNAVICTTASGRYA